MAKQSGDFESVICGIPCQIKVISFTRYRSGHLGHIDNWQPDDAEECEFDVLDRKGYPAPWLEAKMNLADQARIEGEISTLSGTDNY